jgi:hypothetical protein
MRNTVKVRLRVLPSSSQLRAPAAQALNPGANYYCCNNNTFRASVKVAGTTKTLKTRLKTLKKE